MNHAVLYVNHAVLYVNHAVLSGTGEIILQSIYCTGCCPIFCIIRTRIKWTRPVLCTVVRYMHGLMPVLVTGARVDMKCVLVAVY